MSFEGLVPRRPIDLPEPRARIVIPVPAQVARVVLSALRALAREHAPESVRGYLLSARVEGGP